VDDRGRTLERQAAAGDPDAEAALLVHRQRTGDLPPGRLELAAHLGHPAALRALGRTARRESQDNLAWIVALEPWGAPVVVRALVAAARVVLPMFEALAAEDDRPRRALEATLGWCDAPAPSSAQAARAAGKEAAAAAQTLGQQARLDGEWQEDDPALYAGFHAAYASNEVTAVAFVAEREQGANPVGFAPAVAKFLRVIDRAGAPAATTRERTRAELLAWALAGDGPRGTPPPEAAPHEGVTHVEQREPPPRPPGETTGGGPTEGPPGPKRRRT
jgi:hypothetical protein